jgi:hypothetical protein
MTRSFWWAVTAAVIASGARAAPEWVMEASREEVSAERKSAVLTNEHLVQYLSVTQRREHYRFAFRLVSAAARSSASFGVPYSSNVTRVTHATAWVVAAAGSAAQAHRQSEFRDNSIDNHVMWNHRRLLIFDAGPLLPEGGTFACEVETEGADSFETGQPFIPEGYTERQVFEVSPPPGAALTWHGTSVALPEPASGSAPGSLRWEMTAERAPGRLLKPHGFLANPRIVYVRAESGGHRVTWPELSHSIAAVMEPLLVISPGLRDAAQRAVAGRTGRWERIRALSELVQSQIVYVSLTDTTDTWAGMRPHSPAEVLVDRYGDCKDKAALLVTLLRAIGEDGRVLTLNLGDPRLIDPQWPVMSFNHAIVAIAARGDAPADWPVIDGGPLGKMVAFDPTDTTCPLGVLSGGDQRGWALLIDGNNGGLIRLPEAKGGQHMMDTSAVVTIRPDGEASVSFDDERRGLSAAIEYARVHALREDQKADALIASLHDTVPTLHDLAWHHEWKPNPAVFRTHLDFKSDQYVRRLGPELEAISPGIGATIAPFPEWQTAAEGVSWLWTGIIRCHVTLKLPSSYAVEEMPDNWSRTGATVSSHLTYQVTNDEIRYDSEFSIQPGFYDRSHYEAIRKFIDKFREAERRPILLRKAAPSGS